VLLMPRGGCRDVRFLASMAPHLLPGVIGQERRRPPQTHRAVRFSSTDSGCECIGLDADKRGAPPRSRRAGAPLEPLEPTVNCGDGDATTA
jgi:hypothetical protein